VSLLGDLRSSPELLANLTRREIKGKYKRTAMGQLWSLANPVASMLIYTAVFALIIRVQVPPGDPSGLNMFALWLMCGLLPWTFFMAVVNGGMSSLVANENLIKKVYFPRVTLVVSTTVAALFQWSIEMAVLALALVVVGLVVGAAVGLGLIALVPLVVGMMLLMALFATGAAMLFAIANVYFRDTQHFTSIIFQAWFYLTPILYPVTLLEQMLESELGDRMETTGALVLEIYQLNPIARFAEVFRDLMYNWTLPDPQAVLICVAWTVLALVVGSRVFERHQGRLAEAL
jgi:ABC-type polysaccharide/polyol phosphate export permease